MSTVIEVDLENFEAEVLQSSLPVLVDFYADGCGPCQFIAPILDELAEEYEGRVKFTKFYVQMEEVLENSNDVVNRYEVMGFPTLLIFNNGEMVSTHLGSLDREELIGFVKAAL